MNKLLMISGLILTLTACDDGGMFDQDTPTMNADEVTRIEATGFDLRLYEFTPKTEQNMRCVFVSGDKKAGLDCFPKGGKND